MPKSSIEEMKNSMLCTTDITIYFAPILHHCWINYCLTIRRIHKSQIVPARTCPLWHSICFSFSCEIISQADIDPFRNSSKRGFSVTRWFIFFYFWELQREIPIRQEPARNPTSDFPEGFISLFEHIPINPTIVIFCCRK